MNIRSIVDTLQSIFPEIPRQRWLLVDSEQQQMYLLNELKVVQRFNISTSRYGLGNLQDSFQTPTGLHTIKNKIGNDAPLGAVFVGRKATGEILCPEQWMQNDERDLILTRILWLQGMQVGVNAGGDCDTYERYIYIHGTHEENLLGTAVSHGCIRMSNLDIVMLYEQMQEGDLVYIQ